MAEYLPILDAEIAPEAPGTSILFHKNRDNPLAIAEGAAGAPKILSAAINAAAVTAAKIAALNVNTSHILVATGAVALSANNTSFISSVRPGGVLALSFIENIVHTGGATHTAEPKTGTSFSVTAQTTPITRLNFAHKWELGGTIPSGVYTTTWTYLAAAALERGFNWILKEKTSGLIISEWLCQDHPCYAAGRPEIIKHPFDNYDPVLHDIFCVPMSLEQMNRVLMGQIPIVGGGYLTPELFISELYDIDYTRHDLTMIQSFNLVFNVNYGASAPWPDDNIVIAPPRAILGQVEPVRAVIVQPAEINCIGLSLI